MAGSFLAGALRLLAFAVSIAAIESAATACLPPLPGERLPTEEEILRGLVRGDTIIAYGRLVRGSDHRRGPLFRVRHVYRGALRRGELVRRDIGWGFPGSLCPGMIQPPPTPGGWDGVAVIGSSEMRFLTTQQVQTMLRLGLMAPGPHDPPPAIETVPAR